MTGNSSDRQAQSLRFTPNRMLGVQIPTATPPNPRPSAGVQPASQCLHRASWAHGAAFADVTQDQDVTVGFEWDAANNRVIITKEVSGSLESETVNYVLDDGNPPSSHLKRLETVHRLENCAGSRTTGWMKATSRGARRLVALGVGRQSPPTLLRAHLGGVSGRRLESRSFLLTQMAKLDSSVGSNC